MTNQLFAEACRYIPGGVNSPVRAFKSVGGEPLFIKRAQGPYIWDTNDQRYVDFVCSWGAVITEHADASIISAITAAAANGLSFGAPTCAETEFAKQLHQLIPSMVMSRLVNSGSEATMSAIRLARGYTQRSLLVKFEGCYHGHGDSLLVKAGSGVLTHAIPGSAGVPEQTAALTLALPYNDLEQLDAVFRQYGEQIAAVIVEPIAGNMNMVIPDQAFHQGLRRYCDQYGALLIFDEVMTGFRVAQGGAQALYGITPDLTTFGKVIGGGLPLAAFGGRREIMETLAPNGPVYQAGTLSGNPLATAAGLAVLKQINAHPELYQTLEARLHHWGAQLTKLAAEAGIALCTQAKGGMFGLYFSERLPRNLAEVSQGDLARFKRFFHAMLANGAHLAPSPFEAGFITLAHSSDIFEQSLASARLAFKQI